MSEEERRQFLNEMGIGSGSIPKALPVAALQVAIKASGFLAYKLALIIANAIAQVILGRGLAFAANSALTRRASVFAGPIGWIITGLWTAIDLAGPAYRVTIPCVVHIAMLRQKLLSSYSPSVMSPALKTRRSVQSAALNCHRDSPKHNNHPLTILLASRKDYGHAFFRLRIRASFF